MTRFTVFFGLITILSAADHCNAAPIFIDFDGETPGTFSGSFQEDGFDIAYIGFGDLPEIVSVGGANQNIFRDSAQNVFGAEIVITTISRLPFRFFALDYDNSGDGSSFDILVTEDGGPPTLLSAPPGTPFITHSNPAPREINELRVNIVSGGADYGVDNILLVENPEPSALVLLSVGTIGLIAFRRWQQKSGKS